MRPARDGGLGQSAGEERLPAAGGSDDEDVLVAVHPLGAGQAEHLRTVETARVAEVDVLDAGRGAQLGDLEVALDASVVAVLGLAVDEQPQPLLEAERLILGALQLLAEGAGHAHQVEGVELVQGRGDEHGEPPRHW